MTPTRATKKPGAQKKSATTAELFDRLGLRSDWDFALHLPHRYEDETRITPLRQAHEGVECQIEIEITHCEIAYRPRRQLVAQGKDATGIVYFRFLNFYGSMVKQLAPGTRVRAFGEVRQGFFGAEMIHPRFKTVTAETPLADTLTPVYPTTAGLSQNAIRRAIEGALQRLGVRLDEDTLPETLKRDMKLGSLAESIRALHHPAPEASQTALSDHTHLAWRRIKFDEILAQQIAMRRARAERDAKRAPPMRANDALLNRFRAALPFALTGAQGRVFDDIARDLARPVPMQRLLQGDVGSGKTVVAAMAALIAIGNGFQAALMAPTEILAEQHHRKLSALLAPLGIGVTWLAGSLKAKEKREAATAIANGAAQLAIGTHALFQDDVVFAKLGLAIVDEQHRFGVGQRLALRSKGTTANAIEPHQLMMSATPIPRTLSMTYLADLDVSVIDDLPPGRSPVTTKLIADTRRDEVLGRIRHEVIGGAQVYWVCPLIEESETLQLKTATDTFERMKVALPELNIGLVHGRLKPAEKNAVMSAFLAREIHVLVATTVIEVGVDVPNASLMVIEHAERMGLSQLHQLRGRVGRGARQSACILLFQNPLSENARARLKVIYESHDGFEIAREDLRLRGPGEYLGARQSGAPMLRFADVERDLDLIEAGRNAAAWMLEKEFAMAEAHLNRWLGSRQHYLKA
ncbi:MAG: ATP-dependent DNA helicase RecG [Betaproteobacteria bacterium]|nr:ATP-dependent DNA helicase RecG [Betaproteobacteria bacterium]